MRALVALLLLPAPFAMASHTPSGLCQDPSPFPYQGLGIVEVSVGPHTSYYVDDRDYLQGWSIWIYEETNGAWASHGAPGVYRDDLARHNLQRGGVSPYVPGDYEICVDDDGVRPDTLIF